MKYITLFLTIILQCCVVFISTSQVKVIKAGGVLNVSTGEMTKDQTIVIDGSTIIAIGKNIDTPKHAEIIDMSDKYVMPGLMDCHTHLCWDIEDDGYAMSIMTHTTGYRAIQGVVNAKDMLMAGFTTVRDVGNSGNYICTDLRIGIEKGMIPGPTVINAGRLIAPFGGQRGVTPEKPDITQPEYFFADTRDEIKKAIRENIHFGAKVIKIVVDDQKYIYSADDIKFIVEEAAEAGLKVAAHCATKKGAHNAIEAGVASIEHGFEMDRETFIKAKEKGIYFVSTTFSLPAFQSMWYDDPEKMYEKAVKTLREAREAGVKVAFGSDVISTLPGHNRGTATLTFIDSHLDAGYTPLEIIQSMTIHAANLIGIGEHCGSISKGMVADIIVVRENPLKNIHTLKEVEMVMKNGIVYR
ncbi:amidohydrolase family protein [Fulvivirga ulvae]|uniref:amidohydrolase family protein n=1 Tax=Fulvivirga ulvae TaxID=2904245 RepID=UPI001F20AEF6|nr:amidohydrolase family protein [Fulvivirga ulvae]UII35014.1 amidohydrolase family protein [Fulvivirga ulvae]